MTALAFWVALSLLVGILAGRCIRVGMEEAQP